MTATLPLALTRPSTTSFLSAESVPSGRHGEPAGHVVDAGIVSAQDGSVGDSRIDVVFGEADFGLGEGHVPAVGGFERIAAKVGEFLEG